MQNSTKSTLPTALLFIRVKTCWQGRKISCGEQILLLQLLQCFEKLGFPSFSVPQPPLKKEKLVDRW